MPRRQPKQAAPVSLIAKLDNVPGPEADAETLKTHYRRVQNIMATHRYEDVIYICHWCCDGDAELAFADPAGKHGSRKYCSARCANGYHAYVSKVVAKGQQVATPSSSDDTEDDTYDPPPGAAQPTPTRPRARPVAVAEITEVVGQEGTGKTTVVAPRKPPVATPRKPRATKQDRTDGKCAKGLHDMTEANTYIYNGNKWCRECRKASRTKSVEKRDGS